MAERLGALTCRKLCHALLALALCAPPASAMSETPPAPGDVPRTAGSLDPDASQFRFVVVSDRTGAHRRGVFGEAMRKVELLQPDFIVSIGDLIEGYTEDEAEIGRQWDELESRLAGLSEPFVFVTGNHDVSNPAMARIWRERRGPRYWSFMHKGVLFIGLSTEDPPVLQSPETLESTHRIEQAMAADPQATQAHLLEAVRERGSAPELPGKAAISDAQVDFVRKALADYPDARWTFVLLHKPAWKYANAAFAKIEDMLQGRPYTVIAGHEHYYSYEKRSGRDYIVLGTTGGVWLKDGPGRMDHVTMVTMTGEKPVIANLSIDGIFPKEGPTAAGNSEVPEAGEAAEGQREQPRASAAPGESGTRPH